jgi:hypothetical protein
MSFRIGAGPHVRHEPPGAGGPQLTDLPAAALDPVSTGRIGEELLALIASRAGYDAGEVGACDLWFPDIELPVGFGQTSAATRLMVMVMVMVAGYSRACPPGWCRPAPV